MSEPVRHVLDLFDTLPEPDKQSAVAAILLRRPSGEPTSPTTGSIRSRGNCSRPSTPRRTPVRRVVDRGSSLFWYWAWLIVWATGASTYLVLWALNAQAAIPRASWPSFLCWFATGAGFVGMHLVRCPRCQARFASPERFVRPLGRCHSCAYPGPRRFNSADAAPGAAADGAGV